MVLADLQADKATDGKYNQNDYINKRIEDNDMEVEEDIVIVDGWQFEIDRSVPQIINDLAKLTEEEMLKPTITKVTTSVEVKYTNGEKDTFATNQMSNGPAGVFYDFETELRFRDGEIDKIRFIMNGWDPLGGGSRAYIKHITINLEGRTYLIQDGKPVNSELYG